MRYLPFFLLIFSFPLGVLSRFSINPSIHIYIHDVFVVIILSLFVQEIGNYLFHARSKVLSAFAGLSVISIIGIVTHVNSVQELEVSILYMLRLFAYILIMVPLFSAPHTILIKLKNSMLISGFIFVAFGYLQYIFYPNLRNLYYLGWDEHLSRLFSTLLDPNFSGIFILLVFILFLSQSVYKFKTSKIFAKTFYICGVVFLSVALLLTYSRSVYITSIIVLITYFYAVGYKKFAGIILGCFVVGIVFLPQGLGGEGVNLFRTASIFARFDANMQGVIIFLQNPIFGVGYNTLRFVQSDYGFINTYNALNSNAAAGFPNSYIVILATTGVLGFSLVSFIFYRLWKWIALVRLQRVHASLANCVYASFLAILVSSLFENTLFYGLILLWFVLEIGILKGLSKA